MSVNAKVAPARKYLIQTAQNCTQQGRRHGVVGMPVQSYVVNESLPCELDVCGDSKNVTLIPSEEEIAKHLLSVHLGVFPDLDSERQVYCTWFDGIDTADDGSEILPLCLREMPSKDIVTHIMEQHLHCTVYECRLIVCQSTTEVEGGTRFRSWCRSCAEEHTRTCGLWYIKTFRKRPAAIGAFTEPALA